MKILVSGSSGLVGSALVRRFAGAEHRIIRLLRSPGGDEEATISWDGLAAADLEGLDWVVHLAGENIAARRWSAAQKERISSSRVEPTRR